ncbi:MAG: leader peptide processing enzyme [Treponema sp.]|nr:leader peptide processing enzyme [Treponema sp.]
MNKRLNTVLFILGATLFNILVTVLSFLLLLIIYAQFALKLLPEGTQMWSFPLIFIAAMVIAFIVYRYALRFLMKKIEMEKYFDPLFIIRQRKDKR